MAKVYVINKMPGQDYTQAEKFGQVKFLTSGRVNGFEPVNNLLVIQERLKNLAREDYILLNSMSSLNFIAGFLVGRSQSKIGILIYSPKDEDYIAYEIWA